MNMTMVIYTLFVLVEMQDHLHKHKQCVDDPASDPALPVSEGRGRNFDACAENGHPSDTAYGSAAVAVKVLFSQGF